MFDPQMLMNMFGNMNFPNNQNNDNANNNMQNNPLFSMMGSNPSMLTGLMQMFNNNNTTPNNTPVTGKNTYVSNKISDKKNVNSELYHIIKNAENINWHNLCLL